MSAKFSPLISRLTSFCWLFVPTLMLFSFLFGFYQFKTQLFDNWLESLAWLSYVALLIAGLIAWQFGRSRLVYASLLLGIFVIQMWIEVPAAWSQAQLIGFALSLLFLLYSKDKGFSLLNLLSSLIIFTSLFLLSWWLIPHLSIMLQPWLTTLDSVLFKLDPELLSIASSFNLTIILCILLLSLIRLIVLPDNNHNALFFALLVGIAIHFHPKSEFDLMAIVALSALFCYAVIKDSFTMAFKDELTGIPSRRALMQYVQTMGRKYTVVMSDIDHFKKFNDTYGHDVGDEVLKLVASKLANVSGGGKTFRFGGEEFIMLFPRKTATEVVPFVEIVRQTIADYDIALRAKPRPPKPNKAVSQKPAKDKIVKVTTSFGIAQRSKQHNEFADIMKQADIALYAAKKAGRNCVKVAKQ